MRNKLLQAAALLFIAAACTLLCDAEHEDTAPSEPNELHPNATSPDEQGESGSLIEPAPKD